MGWLSRPQCRYRLDLLVHEVCEEFSTECPYVPEYGLFRRNERGRWELARNIDHEFVWACSHHAAVVQGELEENEAFFLIQKKWGAREKGTQ